MAKMPVNIIIINNTFKVCLAVSGVMANTQEINPFYTEKLI